jgi:hypothetical protein
LGVLDWPRRACGLGTGGPREAIVGARFRLPAVGRRVPVVWPLAASALLAEVRRSGKMFEIICETEEEGS